MNYEIADSGARRDFGTGSVRDVAEGKGIPTLLCPFALTRLAQHMEKGCRKYGSRNWELGQPLSSYMDSMLRHAFKLIGGADDGEDHAAAMLWNAHCYVSTQSMIERGELPKELWDVPNANRSRRVDG